MTAKKHAAAGASAPPPMTKEGLWHRVEAARTAHQLDAIEGEARAIGYSPGGVLLTAIADKRAEL